MYAYIVLEYVVNGKLTKLITENEIQNMTVTINDHIRDKNGNTQQGKLI